MITTGTAAIVAAAIVSLAAHFMVGAAKSLVTLRSWWSAGLEMTLAGVIVGGRDLSRWPRAADLSQGSSAAARSSALLADFLAEGRKLGPQGRDLVLERRQALIAARGRAQRRRGCSRRSRRGR